MTRYPIKGIPWSTVEKLLLSRCVPILNETGTGARDAGPAARHSRTSGCARSQHARHADEPAKRDAAVAQFEADWRDAGDEVLRRVGQESPVRQTTGIAGDVPDFAIVALGVSS